MCTCFVSNTSTVNAVYIWDPNSAVTLFWGVCFGICRHNANHKFYRSFLSFCGYRSIFFQQNSKWPNNSCEIITVTSQWARWRLKSPASRLFTQPFIQEQIKENIKAPRHWPLCGEFTGDRWISPHKWLVTQKMFPFDDVIMFVAFQWLEEHCS